MQYRYNPKNNDKISTLAYGCMRFPEKFGKIDPLPSEKLLQTAYDNGINYFDTAYPYHGGHSESFVGNFFYKTKLREKVKIATKQPVWSVNSYSDMEKIFDTQLDRLKTNYIDYYLLHALNGESWKKVYELGVLDFLTNLKNSGKITNYGFSFHGLYSDFEKIIDSYNWDFCQIQFNYLDINYQAGLKGLEYASSKNMAIMIMEPLRGGALASAPKNIIKTFEETNKSWSPARWSLNWILNFKNVTTMLSGMSKISDILENVEIVNSFKPLVEAELNTVIKVREEFNRLLEIPCTACNYCMPCPWGVNIPVCFNLYNSNKVFNRKMHSYIMYAQMVNGVLGTYASPSLCTACGACEKKCPQNIQIIKNLKLVKNTFENFKMKIFFKLIKVVISLQRLLKK